MKKIICGLTIVLLVFGFLASCSVDSVDEINSDSTFAPSPGDIEGRVVTAPSERSFAINYIAGGWKNNTPGAVDIQSGGGKLADGIFVYQQFKTDSSNDPVFLMVCPSVFVRWQSFTVVVGQGNTFYRFVIMNYVGQEIINGSYIFKVDAREKAGDKKGYNNKIWFDNYVLRVVVGCENKQHKFKDATCWEPRFCEECNLVEGLRLGHNFAGAPIIDRSDCERGRIYKYPCRRGCEDNEGVPTISVRPIVPGCTYAGSGGTPDPATCSFGPVCRDCGKMSEERDMNKHVLWDNWKLIGGVYRRDCQDGCGYYETR